MRLISDVSEFKSFVESSEKVARGCVVDTSVLFAVTYESKSHLAATEAMEFLAEKSVPLISNVTTRSEFLDVIIRRQLTCGVIEFFNRYGKTIDSSTRLFKILKSVRDKESENESQGDVYVLEPTRLKEIRRLLSDDGNRVSRWLQFCAHYLSPRLQDEWELLEDEYGLTFLEVLEGEINDYFPKGLLWKDLVKLAGRSGLRSSDAMILNFFGSSVFEVLVTRDHDFKYFAEIQGDDKTIVLLP